MKRLVFPVVLLLCLVLLPNIPFPGGALGFRNALINTILYIEIYIVMALGLNIVVGYTGLLDLGYATFMAIGAVTTCMGLMFTKTANGYVNPPFGGTGFASGHVIFHFEGAYLLILLAAGFMAAIFGILRGIPTLKLTGDYYAIVTLGVAEIMWQVFKNEDALTGGAFGIKIQRIHRPLLFGETFNWATWRFYYLVLLVLVATVVVLVRLERSRLGRAFAAIRLDETAAKTNGVNVTTYKLVAFALSAFVGGVGGGLYALWLGNVAVNNIDVWQSILILCALVLGGMGSVRGGIIGGAVLFSLGEILRYPIGKLIGWLPGSSLIDQAGDGLLGWARHLPWHAVASHVPDAFAELKVPAQARFLFYGAVIILMMRFRPGGIFPRKAITSGLSEDELKRRAKERGSLFHLETP